MRAKAKVRRRKLSRRKLAELLMASGNDIKAAGHCVWTLGLGLLPRKRKRAA